MSTAVWHQRTLAGEVSFEGVGLHTGESANLKLKPAPPDAGVSFIRTDLDPAVRIPVSLESRRDQPRRTCLAVGEAEVHTVEHLLAVLHVLGIQNLDIEIDGPEVPGMDGSALEFLDGVVGAGVEDQGCRGRTLTVSDAVAVQSNGASLVAVPGDDRLSVSYTLHYEGAPQVLTQHRTFEIDEDVFRKEIAPARTFVMENEVKELQSRGLGMGASTQNTLVLGENGVIDNELRFPDEFVRHKILDLLGDLFFVRSRISGHVIAHRSGHFLNTELAAKLQQRFAREREVEDILISAHRGLDIRQLQKLLPHRYPFLLVDRILEMGETRAVGLKNVTFNEEYFQGHFPGQPVMPGVLQVEAMAQLAGVLLLRRIEDINRIAYILSIDNVKFRKTVVPGDQLILEAELRKIKTRTGQVQAKASVDGAVVAEALIRFMIVDAY